MFLSSKKSYLFLLLIAFSPLTAMKTFQAKKMMYKHLATLEKKEVLCLGKLSQKIRHKLLVTAHDLQQKQMLTIYLDDWALSEGCSKSNHITDMQGRNITLKDIEVHLKKAHQFKFPGFLYQAIGRKIAGFYIIPHIQEQTKKFTPQLKNALGDLQKIINQSIGIVLMYAYDAQRKKQPMLQIPHTSNAAKVLNTLKSNTRKILGNYLNFKIV